eukprot:CAMPEP_0167816724 /NCGR_PEP_ID=MMETSP0112_2-20121227/3780_1 /TAXON_ID=91324 /ORGANISM="Lotharella globosa, Strain CCCM811" /LENGTH=360 /DNA_ID=CAMNT_0007716373 /DNA_START=76 /DNA_END=1155 /DNA_ORIENTATION=+
MQIRHDSNDSKDSKVEWDAYAKDLGYKEDPLKKDSPVPTNKRKLYVAPEKDAWEFPLFQKAADLVVDLCNDYPKHHKPWENIAHSRGKYKRLFFLIKIGDPKDWRKGRRRDTILEAFNVIWYIQEGLRPGASERQRPKIGTPVVLPVSGGEVFRVHVPDTGIIEGVAPEWKQKGDVMMVDEGHLLSWVNYPWHLKRIFATLQWGGTFGSRRESFEKIKTRRRSSVVASMAGTNMQSFRGEKNKRAVQLIIEYLQNSFEPTADDLSRLASQELNSFRQAHQYDDTKPSTRPSVPASIPENEQPDTTAAQTKKIDRKNRMRAPSGDVAPGSMKICAIESSATIEIEEEEGNSKNKQPQPGGD